MSQHIYIFDIDDTLIHTTAQVHLLNEQDELICKYNSSTYNTRIQEKETPMSGWHFDYSEFNSFDILSHEAHRPPMTTLLELSHRAQSHNIYIITAREDRYLIAYWLHTLGIDLSLDHIIVNDFSGTPLGQWKAEQLDKIIKSINKYMIDCPMDVHIYEDDLNCKECMAALDGQYEQVFLHIEDINRTWNGI